MNEKTAIFAGGCFWCMEPPYAKLDGVKKVNVDLKRGSIEVDYNRSTSENEIRDQIEHVGCRIE